MQVSIETTSGLERRITVGVPAGEIDSEVNKRLQEAAKTVRINGFRKGKVPLKVVRQRFGQGVRQEVLGDAINRNFYQAIREQDLKPAGQPRIEPKSFAEGQDFEFIATFEVYPEIDLKRIDGQAITQYSAEVTEADIDTMIETLRKNQAKWDEVQRAADDGDRVNIDFEGFKAGEIFDGGSAKGHNLVLGSKSMIPGFEDGIIGMQPGEEKTIQVTFPEDYQAENLRGAAVDFKIKVNKVFAKQLPELNDEFFAALGVTEGGLEKFRTDVKENMEREKDKLIRNKVKTQALDAFLAANEFDVPKALVASEIQALRQQTLAQYGQQLDPKMDFSSILPDSMYQDRAQRRTALGLLVAELVKVEKLSVDQARLEAMIESIAATYEDPESVVSYYYSNKELLSGAEAAVLEDQVVDLLLSGAQVETKQVAYQELVEPDNNSAE